MKAEEKELMYSMKNSANLLEGPIFRNVLLFTIPIACSCVLQFFLNTADSIIVGQFVGQTEFAAVGSTATLVNFLTCLCIGLSIGANITTARYIGARDGERVKRTVHTSVLVSITSGIFAGGILFCFAGAFLRMLDTPSEILPIAENYLRWVAIGIPGLIVFNFGTAILRAKGDAMRPLYFLITAGILRIVLNLFFIPVLDMGVVGAGAASAISQFTAAGLVILFLTREESAIRLHLGKLRITKKELMEIITIGIPASVQSVVFSGSNLLIQAAINSFDSTVIVAGNAAASSIEGVVEQAMVGSYHTIQILVGQNLGARNFKRIRKGLFVTGVQVIAIGAVLGSAAFYFRDGLLSIYTADVEAIRYGTLRMTLVLLPLFLSGYMDVVLGAIRGLGYSFLAMMISLIGICGTRVLWIYTIFQKIHTMECLYTSFPISWVLAVLSGLIGYRIVLRKAQKAVNLNIEKRSMHA